MTKCRSEWDPSRKQSDDEGVEWMCFWQIERGSCVGAAGEGGGRRPKDRIEGRQAAQLGQREGRKVGAPIQSGSLSPEGDCYWQSMLA